MSYASAVEQAAGRTAEHMASGMAGHTAVHRLAKKLASVVQRMVEHTASGTVEHTADTVEHMAGRMAPDAVAFVAVAADMAERISCTASDSDAESDAEPG